MCPQNIDEVDRYLLEQHGTDTIREVIMHDDWPDFGHQARGDGRTIIRYPDDEDIYFSCNQRSWQPCSCYGPERWRGERDKMPRKYDLLGPFETTAQERLSPDEIAGWAEYTKTEDDAPEMNPLTLEHGAAPRCQRQGKEPDCPEFDN